MGDGESQIFNILFSLAYTAHLKYLHLHEIGWSMYEILLKFPPPVGEGLQTIELLDKCLNKFHISIATLTMQQEWIPDIPCSVPEIPCSICLQLSPLKITQQCFLHLLSTFLRLSFQQPTIIMYFQLLLHLSAFYYSLLLILSSNF